MAKKKKPGPRPKLRTEAQRKRFLAVLTKCRGRRWAACYRFGISAQTLINEEERDPEFAKRVEECRDASIEAMIVKGLDMGHKGDGAMIRFFLPRLRPGEFAETQLHKHSGAIDVRPIQVIEDANWFGNDAHDDLAQGPAASDPGANLASPNEAGGVRPAVGQDGDGPAGEPERPRPETGSEAGSD